VHENCGIVNRKTFTAIEKKTEKEIIAGPQGQLVIVLFNAGVLSFATTGLCGISVFLGFS